MHEAFFDLALAQGVSAVKITYRQAWGRIEREFKGYFSGWLTARALRYEMWPLRGWTLAPAFRLAAQVRVRRGTAAAGLIRWADERTGPLEELAVLERAETGDLVFHRQWGRSFPARLELVTGSGEAVATYGVEPPSQEREPDLSGEW
jgi:hypothetical protein